MSALSQVMMRRPIQTDCYVVLTIWEVNALSRFAAIDYRRGFCKAEPEFYFEGREVIPVRTLGL